jgi:serine/threonine protein kinase/formylglycine-generating enzyme required for sulfatase activity
MSGVVGDDSELERELQRDGLCDRFELEWGRGLAPRIEDYLAEVPELERPTLFRELLRLELALSPVWEAAGPGAYRERFPGWGRMIDSAFGERGPEESEPRGDEPDAVGAVLDGRTRYRVVEFRDRGGGGVVYLAEDEGLGREVALKLVHARHAADPNLRKRFAYEARLTGRLEHPGVVPVHAAGEAPDGRPYFVTKFVRGTDLGTAIDRLHAGGVWGRADRDARRALRVLLQRFVAVCDTIAYAHSVGVVHRDVKPKNVLLGDFGETLVIDWGMAKEMDAGPDPDSGGEAAASPPPAPGPERGDATVHGVAVGTPVYMSPEQAAGDADRVGPTSDVYGLGATLYHLLTGRPPFDPNRAPEAVRRLVHAGLFLRPRRACRGVPRALEAVCLRAMAREPAARYATARALADDLERWLAGDPVSVHRASAPARLLGRSRRHPLVAGVAITAAVLAIAGASAWGVRRAMVRARIGAVARQVESVPLEDVPALEDTLLPDREVARALLRDRIAGAPPRAAEPLALALAGLGPDGMADLARRLRSEPDFRRRLVEALLRDDGHTRTAGAARLQALVRPVGVEVVDELLAGQSRAVSLPAGSPDWDVARQVVLDFCPDDRLDVLVRCLLDAEDAEFAAILARLGPRAGAARAELHRALAVEGDHGPFRPIDPAWSSPDADAVGTIQSAGGMVDPRFLLGPRLPLARLAPLCEALRPSGFRPQRVRPYRTADDAIDVAVLWTRDGGRFAVATGATAEGLFRRDEEERRAGLQPVDVAVYPDPHGGAIRYAAVWAEPDPPYQRRGRERVRTRVQAAWLGDPLPPSRLVVGLSPDQARRDEEGRYNERWRAPTAQCFTRADGTRVMAQVREDEPGFDRPFAFTLGPESALRDGHAHGLVVQDVGLDAGAPEAEIVTWAEPGWFQSTVVRTLDPSELRARCGELVARGALPRSISVRTRPDGAVETATLWHGGRPHLKRGQALERSARLVLALDRLGDPEPLAAALRHGPDPTLRTLLIDMLPRLGPTFDALFARLLSEPDASSRRALVLALGAYTPPAASHPAVGHLLGWVNAQPDAGLRAAAWWTLGRWGRDAEREREAARLSQGEPGPRDDRGWYVNVEGHVLTILRGPVTFDPGQPLWDLADERFWLPHRVRIDRDFALGATEVTAAQYGRFREGRSRSGTDGAVGGGPTRFGPYADGPALNVNFLDAARYCNWLSERAGLPPDQWCFEESPDGTLRLAPDHLNRAGYRLPTEAEWECACRAGATTLRPFGRIERETILEGYAWYLQASRNQSWPVARLKPNDLGLFDMLGNAHEWCLDAKARYCLGQCDRERPDAAGAEPLSREGDRMLRGGWFHQPANALTAAHRSWSWAAQAHYESGFRVARTLRPLPPPSRP